MTGGADPSGHADEYRARQHAVLRHMAGMVDSRLPALPDTVSFQGTGFQALPSIALNASTERPSKVSAHIEGGWWIAKMFCEPDRNYDEVIRRLLLIIYAEESSGKPRYIEVSDFVVAQLVRIYVLFRGGSQVSEEVWSEVEKLFRSYHYATFHEPMSENHKIAHLSSKLFAVHRFPQAMFQDGFTGEQLQRQVKGDIIRFLDRRIAFGWSEFDSSGYYNVDFAALLNLIDAQPDEEINELAHKTLNFMLADLLHHSAGGYVGGAKGRVKLSNIANSRSGAFWPLYVCTGEPQSVPFDDELQWSVPFFATSRFRPHSAISILCGDREEPYEVKERSILYSIPDDEQVTGSVKRYHFVTEDCVMGAIVHKDELEPYNFHRWLNGHQELSWSLVFAGHPEAIVFSSHPGHEGLIDWGMHDYWTGDTHCGCHHYVQHRHILLGRNDIVNKEQLQWIHFYIPKHAFDRVHEAHGWLLLQCGQCIAAIRPEPGYYWTTRGEWTDREVIVPAANSAFAVELFQRSSYSIEQLVPLLKDKAVSLAGGLATYTSLSGDCLELGSDGQGKVNGVIVDYSQYPKFSSRHMYSEWGSDTLIIQNQASNTRCWI